MSEKGDVIGWRLDRESRALLLAQYPPRWPDVVADHVTLATDAGDSELPAAVHCEIIGEADDGEGVQALVVEIDGSSQRPDGSTFHITWSLDRAAGREAADSNGVIARRGWRAGRRARVELMPARW